MVPIDGGTSIELPFPLRHNLYNQTSLFDASSPTSDSGMECDLETTQSHLKSSFKSESSRGTKCVSYGTIETKYTKNEECQTDRGIDDARHIVLLENKVDMLMEKMDTILDKIQ